MTSLGDVTVWQDVYHIPFNDLVIYMKFRADAIVEFQLLSFKEKQQQ